MLRLITFDFRPSSFHSSESPNEPPRRHERGSARCEVSVTGNGLRVAGDELRRIILAERRTGHPVPLPVWGEGQGEGECTSEDLR